MSVVFLNDGLVPMEAFTSFGVSAKVGENPIGEFGTGLKMATAVILRLGGTIRVFRDGTEYEFYTKKKSFREKDFDWVMMRRRKIPARWMSTQLPFTTELAKKWQAWQAVREIESNCRDEGGISFCRIASDSDHHNVLRDWHNKTAIVVDCPEFEDAYCALHNIFLDTSARTLLWKDDMLEIWDQPSRHIWYRGLRVTDLDNPSIFTYNFLRGVDLTEDRTSKYPYWDKSQICVRLANCGVAPIEDALLNLGEDDDVYEATMDWESVRTLDYSLCPPTIINRLINHQSSGATLMPRMASLVTRYTPPDPVATLRTEVQIKGTVAQWLMVHKLCSPSAEATMIMTALRSAGWPGEKLTDLVTEPVPTAETDTRDEMPF